MCTHVREPRWTGSGNVVHVEIVLGQTQTRTAAPEDALTPAQAAALAAFADGVELLRPRIAEALRAWWDIRPEPFRSREAQMEARGRARPDAPTPWDFNVTRIEIGHGEPVLVRVVVNRTVGVCLPVTVTLRGDAVLRVADERSAWGEEVARTPFVRTDPPPDPNAAPRRVPPPAAPISGAGPAEGHTAWRYEPETNTLFGELALPGWNAAEATVPLEIGLRDDALQAWRDEDAAITQARAASPGWQGFQRELAATGRASVDQRRMDTLLGEVDAFLGPKVDFAAFILPEQRAALERFAARRDLLLAEVRARIADLHTSVDPSLRAALTARRRHLHEAANAMRRARAEATGEPPTPDDAFVEEDTFRVHRAWILAEAGPEPAELVLLGRVEGAMTRDLHIRIRGEAIDLT